MAYIQKAPNWSDVYQIEITDDVLGGENGTANRQAVALVERTEWLKNGITLLVNPVEPFTVTSGNVIISSSAVRIVKLGVLAFISINISFTASGSKIIADFENTSASNVSLSPRADTFIFGTSEYTSNEFLPISLRLKYNTTGFYFSTSFQSAGSTNFVVRASGIYEMIP